MRVLVVQTAHLGDLVLTVPLLRALRAAEPDGGTHLTLLTTAGGAELLEGQAWIDAIRVFGKGGPVGETTGALLRTLGREGFDVAIAAQRSFRTGAFVRATRAPLRVGFAGAPGRWAYTASVPRDPDRHAVERYLALAGPVPGVESSATPPRIDVSPVARKRARALLERHGLDPDRPLVALAPGSRWGTKRWLPEGFAEVARETRERGRQVVLVGSEGERELCGTVARSAAVVSVAGETPLPVLAGVLAGARLLVANDSGTGHLAAAVGTPVVTVFGPTAPVLGYRPYGTGHRVVELRDLECRPCHPHGPERCPLGHFRCMRELPAGDVSAAVEGVVSGGPEAPNGVTLSGDRKGAT